MMRTTKSAVCCTCKCGMLPASVPCAQALGRREKAQAQTGCCQCGYRSAQLAASRHSFASSTCRMHLRRCQCASLNALDHIQTSFSPAKNRGCLTPIKHTPSRPSQLLHSGPMHSGRSVPVHLLVCIPVPVWAEFLCQCEYLWTCCMHVLQSPQARQHNLSGLEPWQQSNVRNRIS